MAKLDLDVVYCKTEVVDETKKKKKGIFWSSPTCRRR